MADRIKVSAVSYVNSYPFIFGLRNHAVAKRIELRTDNPADCANKLLRGEVDLGLVPVAIIPQLKNAHIITDKCIGADGAVETVCLFSDVPLEEIREVLLDHQSRTSVQLVRILAERHWHIRPKWVEADTDFMDHIGGETAGVVIGDRAFGLKGRFAVEKDLAEEWKRLTGLPFVFACWVSNRDLGMEFETSFNSALEFGLKNRERAMVEMGDGDTEDLLRYVNEVISYRLDARKRKAMKLFLDWSSSVT